MAVGKNKRKPRKGAKKKIIDPFARKDWYHIKAPAIFKNTEVGRTPVNQTQGKVLASDNLKGRVFRVSLADLNKDEDRAYRVIHLIGEEVQGNNLLTNFHSMSFTTERVKSLIKKWQTLIEARAEVKTTDGYVVRMFAIGFTKRRPLQQKVTSYAQTSQAKRIRKKMVDIMTREASSCDLRQLFLKFVPETIGKMIENETQGIYPLKDVYIRKAKILRRPKFDAFKLQELHSASSPTEDQGTPVVAATTPVAAATPVVGATTAVADASTGGKAGKGGGKSGGATKTAAGAAKGTGKGKVVK
jgi:small subunit ribosomal protein S3Ae